MCYNISLLKNREYLEKRFDAKFEEPNLFMPIYHSSGFSAPNHPVIANETIHSIRLFQWGLIPFWVQGEEEANRIRFNNLNARAESIHQKPSFRASIKSRRCLVLADGFYEWQEVDRKKYPYHIRLGNHDAFAMAGIWDVWSNKQTGELKNTFSIITTRANPLLEVIHNTRKRMPVILRKEDEKKWLTENLATEEIDSMLVPYNEEEMEAFTVSRLISSKRVNTNIPEVMSEVRYAELEK